MTTIGTKLTPTAPNITVSCDQLNRHEAILSGEGPGVHRARYLIETNIPVTAEYAVQLAQVLNTTPKTLPYRGQLLDMTNAGWAFNSTDVFALDFDVYPIDGGSESFKDSWICDVTYRTPVWGQDENPSQITLDPLVRKAEVRWEFIDVIRDEVSGYLVTSGTAAGTPEVMANSIGEPYKSIQIPGRSVVLRAIYNTQDINNALDWNLALERTCNSQDITVLGVTIPKYRCRFLGAEQFEHRWHNGFQMYRTDVRFEVSREEFFQKFRNEGSYYLDTAGAVDVTVQTDSYGIPISSPYPIRNDGTLILNATQSPTEIPTRTYCVFKPVDYSSWFTAARIPAA